jgi:hypothetical protein
MPQNLTTWADIFTSSLKEGVLQICIPFKNPSLSAGFEPANLGPKGKHANHYTTEDDLTYDSSVLLYYLKSHLLADTLNCHSLTQYNNVFNVQRD